MKVKETIDRLLTEQGEDFVRRMTRELVRRGFDNATLQKVQLRDHEPYMGFEVDGFSSDNVSDLIHQVLDDDFPGWFRDVNTSWAWSGPKIYLKRKDEVYRVDMEIDGGRLIYLNLWWVSNSRVDVEPDNIVLRYKTIRGVWADHHDGRFKVSGERAFWCEVMTLLGAEVDKRREAQE